jgi:hypothetical protein
MKRVVHELAWLVFLGLMAALILPLYAILMDFRTTDLAINKIEKLFLAQILFLSYLGILIVLYIFRFVITIVLSKFFTTAKEDKP